MTDPRQHACHFAAGCPGQIGGKHGWMCDLIEKATAARDDEHLAREAAERTRMIVALRDVVARLAAAVGVELEVLVPRAHARAVGLTPAHPTNEGSTP